MTDLQPTNQPQRPFLDWPIATEPSGWTAKVALLGIRHSEPYGHDAFPNDQSKAPDAIRARSESFCYNPGHWDFDVGTDLASNLPSHVDMGDVAFDGGDYGAYAAAITARARHLWRQGTQLLVIGGDHGVTIPVVDALDAVGEPVHILHIDAHLDWREEVGGVRRGYSSPLQWASKVKAVSGMTQIGLRAIGSARAREVEAARAYGSQLFSAERIHAEGMDPVFATIPKDRPVYVTIDADGLDPSEAPAVMAPTPGGIYFRQLAPLLRAVARQNRIVGMDIVEIAPSYDFTNGLTSVIAGRLILNVLSASWGAGGAMRN
ncbi:MAG TPA: arginase family protein [Steroidobacteraceae bacterium]|nr:arginase family protein [Steroidobacteraceae bacterium]